MKNWEKYEQLALEYLQKSINIDGISFKREGGFNSNESDIDAFHSIRGKLFSIEAKLSPSQSGQIVVEDKNNKYDLSDKRKYNNKYSAKIIDYLNSDSFVISKNEVDCLNIDESILANWVKEHYSKLGVEYIITSNKLDSFHAILPVSNLDKYFEVGAVLRRKRSGTRHVPIKDRNTAKLDLKKHLSNLNMNECEFSISNKKLLVKINTTTELIKSDLYFGKYFLSPNGGPNNYIIKVRSGNNKLNIVFNLKYKGVESNIGLDSLIIRLN